MCVPPAEGSHACPAPHRRLWRRNPASAGGCAVSRLQTGALCVCPASKQAAVRVSRSKQALCGPVPEAGMRVSRSAQAAVRVSRPQK